MPHLWGVSDAPPDFPLDLLPLARELRRRVGAGGQLELWCLVRRRYVALQPEELVRQAAIVYLQGLGYPVNLMQLERAVPGSHNRLDLLALDRAGGPYLLLEAKRPEVSHLAGVAQLADYRRTVRARYVASVNGVRGVCYEVSEGRGGVKVRRGLPAYGVG